QSCENWAMTVPGLKIVSPSTPRDMAGLLAASIRDNDPVLVFEHKGLYAVKEEAADDTEFLVPLGVANVVREGSDVTLVGLSITVGHCLTTAADLADKGISAEVIDLRSLVPLDAQRVRRSVAKTGRVVI